MLQPRPAGERGPVPQDEHLALTRPWHDVPRGRVFVLGVNQSWRVFPDADAHFAHDADQYAFYEPTAAGFGGRDYYARLHDARAAFHNGSWPNFGVVVDRNDRVVFGRHPYRKAHRGAKVPPPPTEDGGVALKVDPAGNAGSSGYIALQLAAAAGFERIWMVGFDMSAVKFPGAIGWLNRQKKEAVNEGAWSNSQGQDHLWKHVPADVLARVRVIAPCASKVLPVVEWPWPAMPKEAA